MVCCSIAQTVIVEQKSKPIVGIAAHRERISSLGAVGHGVRFVVIDHHVNMAGVADPPKMRLIPLCAEFQLRFKKSAKAVDMVKTEQQNHPTRLILFIGFMMFTSFRFLL